MAFFFIFSASSGSDSPKSSAARPNPDANLPAMDETPVLVFLN
jgi:hypothetical protein